VYTTWQIRLNDPYSAAVRAIAIVAVALKRAVFGTMGMGQTDTQTDRLTRASLNKPKFHDSSFLVESS